MEGKTRDELIAHLDELRAQMNEVQKGFSDQPRVMTQILDNLRSQEELLLKLLYEKKYQEKP